MLTRSKPGFVIGRVGVGEQDNSGAGAKAFAYMLAAQKNGIKTDNLTIPKTLAEKIKFFKPDRQTIVEFVGTTHVFIVEDGNLGEQPKKDYEITSRAVQNLASHFQLYAPKIVLLTCTGKGEGAATRDNILRLLNQKHQGRPARITLYFYGHTVRKSGEFEDNDFSWIIAREEHIDERELRECEASIVNIVADSCYPERLSDGHCLSGTWARVPLQKTDFDVGQTLHFGVVHRDAGEVAALRGEKEELSKQLSASTAQIENLTAQLKASDAAKANWEQEKAKLAEEIEEKSKETLTCYGLLGQRKDELDDAKRKFDELQQRFDAAQAEHKQAMQRLQDQMQEDAAKAIQTLEETTAAHDAAMKAQSAEHLKQLAVHICTIHIISSQLKASEAKKLEVDASVVDSHAETLSRLVEQHMIEKALLEQHCQELTHQNLVLGAAMQGMYAVFEEVSACLETIMKTSKDIETTVERTLPLMRVRDNCHEQALRHVVSSFRGMASRGGASFHEPAQVWSSLEMSHLGNGGAAGYRSAMCLEFHGGMASDGGGPFLGPARALVSPALTSSRSGSEADLETEIAVGSGVFCPDVDTVAGRERDSPVPVADTGFGSATLAKAFDLAEVVAAASPGVP